MSARIRIAVRKFEPFESAIARQFADFTRTSGIDAELRIERSSSPSLAEEMAALKAAVAVLQEQVAEMRKQLGMG